MSQTIRNIVGQVVSGEDFYPRPQEIHRIITALSQGSNILLAAPRRVGKTSILLHLKENPPDGWIFLYITTESVNNADDFFEQLFALLLEKLQTPMNRASKAAKSFFKSITKVGISLEGLSLERSEGKKITTQQCIDLLSHLARNMDEKIIFMIDEFPQTVANIAEYSSEADAVIFLRLNRQIRQNPDLRDKIQFIYTGSIGLEGVVGKLNVTVTINDLQNESVNPLSEPETEAFIRAIIANPQYTIHKELLSEDTIRHIIHKVQWCIPFYIQALLNRLQMQKAGTNNPITRDDIDAAFDALVNDGYHFRHWRERLPYNFKDNELKYALELLRALSQTKEIARGILYDLSIKHSVESDYSSILSTLVHDGYITRDPSSDNYSFNSPLVQAWWRKNV